MAAEDLPALGRHYCVECARWFETDSTLQAHLRGKPHKRRYASLCLASSHGVPLLIRVSYRVKQLKEGPWTQKEAEAVVGLRTDNGDLDRDHKTPTDVDMAS